jgi:hypothetical protein
MNWNTSLFLSCIFKNYFLITEVIEVKTFLASRVKTTPSMFQHGKYLHFTDKEMEGHRFGSSAAGI